LISSPSPLFSSAASTSFLASSSLKSQPGTVIGSVVAAISPFSETRIGVCGETWLTCSASVKKALMRSRAAGLLAPSGSFQTTKISWPEYPSKRSSVRSLAAFDSDPGVL
jgi:hypothetical protein